MKVLVTGGAGFIGSHVSDALLAAGHSVCVLDDLSSGRRENVPAAARFVQGDIRDAATVAKVFADFVPEVVCHQAAQVSVSVSTREPLRDAQINVLGTLNLLQESVARGVQRVVFASTGGAIYGDVPEPERAVVGRQPRPSSPYACSKFSVEAYLGAYRSEYALRFSILRYANVYGPRQDPHGEAGVVAIFCQRLLAGEPIQVNARKEQGDDGCVRDYVYVQDVVKANVAAVEGRLQDDVVNVATGVATTTLGLARALEKLSDKRFELRFGPRREGDVERSVIDPGEAPPYGVPRALESGLGETLAWFRERASRAH
jgi:UDP-glucose 4-epimerase